MGKSFLVVILTLCVSTLRCHQGRIQEYTQRKATAHARAFEEPLLAVLDGRLPASTLVGLVF